MTDTTIDNTGATTSAEFFDRKYRLNPDPWNFASSSYEQGRYDAIYSALDHRRYLRAFEPGCSIGALTKRLSSLCADLQAIDISPTAVASAQQLCHHLPQVKIRCGALPSDVPEGTFDLIVFSEIGYYFAEAQLLEIANQLVQRLNSGGIFLAAHWLGHSEDHILSGDRVHETLNSREGLKHDHAGQHEHFRLDRWLRL